VPRTINAKTLRARLGEILGRVSRGERFAVIYRSRPVCQLVPMDDLGAPSLDLEEDPLYRAGPVGRSKDGRASADHDDLLYGEGRR
jgi:antitoxin (DNA-binding transcriptional repressor) of toxin-antitoxin stability system